MAKIQLFHGLAAEEALDEEFLETFGYQINNAGVGFALGGGLVFLLLAFLLWLFTRLDGALFTGLFAVVVLVGIGLCSLASHWMRFVKDHFIATSPRYLFVGKKDRLWRISWALLDKRTMGFHETEFTTMKGFLDLQVGGQNITVHLFNFFAIVEDIQGLMLQVLEHIPHAPHEADSQEDEEEDDDPSSINDRD